MAGATYGSATCPTGAKFMVMGIATGSYLSRAMGVAPAVSLTTVTDGTAWERNRGGMDINTTISGSTTIMTYVGVYNETGVSNSIPYSCYTARPQ